MTSTARQANSAAEYLDLVASRPHSQLIDGEIIVDEPMEARQLIAGRIVERLNRWTGAAPGRGIALTGLSAILDDHNVYAPDVSYLGSDRALPDRVTHIEGSPDLAVEIRSLAGWKYSLGPKMRCYERERLSELWLIDAPVASVLVYRRSHPDAPYFDVALELIGGHSLTSGLLPGFTLAIHDVFGP